MSIKAMVWAWAQDDITSTETFVLLALADHANDEGLCWPGQVGLAEKTKLTKDTIWRIIRQLESKAKLSIIHRRDENKRNIVNQYQLRITPPPSDSRSPGPSDFNHESQAIVDRPNLLESSESSEEEPSTDQDRLTPGDLVEAWNRICPPLGLAKVTELTATRKHKASARLRDYPEVAFWDRVFAGMRASPFLLGRNGSAVHKGWKANFDWLIENDTNAVKVYEGRYAKEN